jgi:S1-C subfamily serine protease
MVAPGSYKTARLSQSDRSARVDSKTRASRTRSETPRPRADRAAPLLSAVVRVLTVSDEPDYEQPWQTRGPTLSSGSGAIVSTRRGLRILTNAHVVQNQVFVEVIRHGQSRKFTARVEGVGHECDLALLTVDDPEFFRGARPIVIAKTLPPLSSPVKVLGYPIGGERLSVTQGVLSRIEMTPYAQSQRRLLAAQIDAAINSGNSGGPVVRNGKLVGVAFQSLDDAENIGYMIAAPVVRHFLTDLDNGTFDGFPDLGVFTQNLEGRAHRQALGLPANEDAGVLVLDVAFESSAWGKLEPGDVLLAVDGVPIAADATVPFDHGSRIDFSYVVAGRHVGKSISVRVWRDRRARNIQVKLEPPRFLVQEDRYDVKPTYFLFGGLLFVPLTRDYLKTWGNNWWSNAPHGLMDRYERGLRRPDRREVVILQKVLADEANQGLHDLESLEITHVQGQPVRDLRHLIDVVERSREPYIFFKAIDRSEIAIDRKLAVARTSDILERFGVLHDRSIDLRPKSVRSARRSRVEAPISMEYPLEDAAPESGSRRASSRRNPPRAASRRG